MPDRDRKDGPSLRERKKAEVRANVLRIAHELFHANGFDATTVEEICAACKISKRTFFRYFADKEALVFPRREERLATFRAFLEQHEHAESFEMLRLATLVLGEQYNDRRNKILAQQSLVRSSQVLLAREHEIDGDWEREIALSFARRTGSDAPVSLWARVLAGAIMGMVRSTMQYWFERTCEDDLMELGLQAIDHLQSGFPPRGV